MLGRVLAAAKCEWIERSNGAQPGIGWQVRADVNVAIGRSPWEKKPTATTGHNSDGNIIKS